MNKSVLILDGLVLFTCLISDVLILKEKFLVLAVMSLIVAWIISRWLRRHTQNRILFAFLLLMVSVFGGHVSQMGTLIVSTTLAGALFFSWFDKPWKGRRRHLQELRKGIRIWSSGMPRIGV